MTRNDPLALRWLLGSQIAIFRHQAGFSLGQLASITGFTRPKLGTMETGRFGQNAVDVRRVLEACGASDEDCARLTAMAERIEGKSWWRQWADVLPQWLTLYVGLEGLASKLFTAELVVIPGLLQTERYARAVTAATTLVRPDHVERFARFRVMRTERLTNGKHPLRHEVVVSDSALRMRAGDDELMAEQYRHILSLVNGGHVTLRVLLPERGPVPAGHGRFSVLEFDDAHAVVFNELIDDAIYITDPSTVRTYLWAAGELKTVALSPEDSAAYVTSLLKEV